MKKTAIITVCTILFVILATVPNVKCQDYDSVLEALAKLDASIKTLKQNYIHRERMRQQYADINNQPAASDFQRDPLYEFAINLEGFVGEMSGLIEETKIAEQNRPKNPPEVKRGKISFGGFVHEQYYNQNGYDDQSTFISKRARLSVKGKINEFASIKFQGEFATTPKLLDGALILSPNKYWSATFGQYKPPFGTDFLKSATALPFINTAMAKGLGTDRDIGAALTYENNINKDFSFKLTAGLFNGSGINTSDINNDKNIIARGEFKLSDMFTFAPNIITGKTNDTGVAKQNLDCYGGSVTWAWQNEIVEGEYIHYKAGATEKMGWYIWGGHSFDVDWKFLSKWQFLARYEQYDVNTDISGDQVDRITIGTNLYVDGKYTKIQFNYQINNEEGVSTSDNEFLANLQVGF